MAAPDPNRLDQDRLFQCDDPTRAATDPRVVRLSSHQFEARWPGSFGEGPPVQPDTRFRYSTDALDYRMEPEAITTLIRTALESGTSTGFPRCIRVDREFDTDCLTEWFEGHLYRAWARPPTSEEIATHVAFTQDAIARRGYDDGILLGGARPYVSPHFVYRFDLGGGQLDGAGRTRLNAWEVANSLAHALTDQAATDRPRNDREPLEALAAAVEAGELETPEQIEAHVRALIQLPEADGIPRVRAPVLRFFREFLGYPDAIHVFKSGGRTNRRGYAAHVFEEQLDGMIQSAVRSNDDVLRTLLTSNRYWFGDQDGRFPERNYPFNLEDQTLNQWVELPADQRAGILTHPGWLVAHSGNQHTDPHPVHRGKWIRENLLCDTVPAVPVGVDAMIPEDPAASVRQRLAATTQADEFCWGCHQMMDPLGLPFEVYDHYGRYRTEEYVGEADGWDPSDWTSVPADGSSTLLHMHDPALEGRTVSDAVELAGVLAESERVNQCFARQTFRYFLGRSESYRDSCTLRSMADAYAEQGSFEDMLVALFLSDSHLYRAPEAMEEQ